MMVGDGVMGVRSMVHKPLDQGSFKIYVDNADSRSLAFLDRVRHAMLGRNLRHP